MSGSKKPGRQAGLFCFRCGYAQQKMQAA